MLYFTLLLVHTELTNDIETENTVTYKL